MNASDAKNAMLLIRLAAQNLGRRRVRALLLGALGRAGGGRRRGGADRRLGAGRRHRRLVLAHGRRPRGRAARHPGQHHRRACSPCSRPTRRSMPPSSPELAGHRRRGPRSAAAPGARHGRGPRLQPDRLRSGGRLHRADLAARAAPRPDRRHRARWPAAAWPARSARRLNVCRRPMEIHGRLARTGVGPVDDSYFITFAGLDFLAALCSQDSCSCAKDSRPRGNVPARLRRRARSAPCCSSSRPSARPEQVKFAVSQIADVKVVEGNALLTSSRQALRSPAGRRRGVLRHRGAGDPHPGVAAVLRHRRRSARASSACCAPWAPGPTMSWPWCWPRPR